jgi:hypothetical protein
VELMADTLSFEAVVDLMFECVDALITRRTRSFNPGAKLPKPSLAEVRDSRAMVKALQPLPFRACVTVENISLNASLLAPKLRLNRLSLFAFGVVAVWIGSHLLNKPCLSLQNRLFRVGLRVWIDPVSEHIDR